MQGDSCTSRYVWSAFDMKRVALMATTAVGAKPLHIYLTEVTMATNNVYVIMLSLERGATNSCHTMGLWD